MALTAAFLVIQATVGWNHNGLMVTLMDQFKDLNDARNAEARSPPRSHAPQSHIQDERGLRPLDPRRPPSLVNRALPVTTTAATARPAQPPPIPITTAPLGP